MSDKPSGDRASFEVVFTEIGWKEHTGTAERKEGSAREGTKEMKVYLPDFTAGDSHR